MLMAEKYKPDGYITVSPYLIVDGAGETIRFLEAVLGAVELRRFLDDDGRSQNQPFCDLVVVQGVALQ